jgi:hypothetical protein
MIIPPESNHALYSALRIAPLLAFPLAAFVLCAVSSQDGWATAPAFSLNMISGALWSVSYGDLFIFGSLVVLFIEIVKSVNTGASEILNHSLSMLVALICVVLFATASSFTNSTFFMLMAMTFIDVIAGFAITIVAARRDFGTQTSH